MFTGLIESKAHLRGLTPQGPSVDLTIELPSPFVADQLHTDPARIGDSIAINGCCLTIVSIEPASVRQSERWTFQAGSETLSKTNLGKLLVGDEVNIERALPANGRLGGHFVQGHVDGVGSISRINHEEDWVFLFVSCPSELTSLMVPKGSITIDGVSLTLVHVDHSEFSIALIPHTLSVTTLGLKSVGDSVNLETDILGKYAAKFLSAQPRM